MANPQVELHITGHGVITLELDAEKAPKTVENFLSYVRSGHYNGTIFHRVIDGFMIQGGGFAPGMKQKDTHAPIKNEAEAAIRKGVRNGTGYLAMAHDVTMRRDAEHQLQHMAQHDALTGLPNRNMLHEQLKGCLSLAERDHRPVALMLLDLDRFKKINDSLGHHIGDNVLIEVARRLKMGMRTSDIVARLGGDEFVVIGLTASINPDEMAKTAAAMRELGGHLATVQNAFNQWHAESGRPMCQLSMMLAFTVNH